MRALHVKKSNQETNRMNHMKKILSFSPVLLFGFCLWVFQPSPSLAYPIYAQQAYSNPREANGRIVCANCHLAQKPVYFESPKSILPNQVFETVVKIPYDLKSQQILGNGKKGGLNVGAVMILPEGFKLAPKDQLDKELATKMKGVYVTPYSSTLDSILVVGPLPGEKYQDITFPLLSPDPEKNKSIHYIKYPIYVGANRGRGQVYPTGEKSNNNLYVAETSGKIEKIATLDKGEFQITILTNDGASKAQVIPKGLSVVVSEGQLIEKDQPLVVNPNVGGFGQTESEIVLQSPVRVLALLAFCVSSLLSQTFFVLKKKQFEKVQALELEQNSSFE